MIQGGLNTSRGYLIKACLGTMGAPGRSHIVPGLRKSEPVIIQIMPGNQIRHIQGVSP